MSRSQVGSKLVGSSFIAILGKGGGREGFTGLDLASEPQAGDPVDCFRRKTKGWAAECDVLGTDSMAHRKGARRDARQAEVLASMLLRLRRTDGRATEVFLDGADRLDERFQFRRIGGEAV